MENNVDIDFSQELGERQIRRVYLITYSQADMKKMANCQAFADCSLEAFSQSQGNQKDNATHPEHWSCCMEDHQDGGKHYHLAIKCTKAVESGEKLCKQKTQDCLAFFFTNPLVTMSPTSTSAKTSHLPTCYTALVARTYKKLVHQKPNVLSHSSQITQRKGECRYKVTMKPNRVQLLKQRSYPTSMCLNLLSRIISEAIRS